MSTHQELSTRSSSGELAWRGLRGLGVAALLQVMGATLVLVAAIALYATLPFYGAASPEIAADLGARSVAASLAWFTTAVVLTAFTNFKYLAPSLKHLAEWRPVELAKPAELARLCLLLGSSTLLVALLVVTAINAINTPEIIRGYSARRALAEGLIWPITLGLVGGAVLSAGWTLLFAFLSKLGELLDAPVLSKLGVAVLVYGLVFITLKASLLAAYYGYTVARAGIVFALQPVLGLALLLSVLGVVSWGLLYTEVASLEKKLASATTQ